MLGINERAYVGSSLIGFAYLVVNFFQKVVQFLMKRCQSIVLPPRIRVE